jgi:glucose-6-phosphate dehydrogenase assembly protein OpcA
LRELQIQFTEQKTSEDDFPLTPLLLVSWIGSRLGWTPLSKLPLKRTGEKSGSIDFSVRQGKLTCEVRNVGHDKDAIIAVTLRSPKISITITEREGALITVVEKDGSVTQENVTRMESNSEEHLIGKELEILGQDKVYQQALNFLKLLGL